MPFDAVGQALVGIALMLLIGTHVFSRRAFAGDRFAQSILWAVALPLSGYLLKLAAMHWQ